MIVANTLAASALPLAMPLPFPSLFFPHLGLHLLHGLVERDVIVFAVFIAIAFAIAIDFT